MAEQNPNITTNSFTKGLIKDLNDSYISPDSWTHARNLVNNSHDGELGIVGNEPSNISCVTLPYTYIGGVSLGEGEWAIFSTDDVNSEIGIFNENKCIYTKVVNDSCLAFNRAHLISGAYKKRFDCGRDVFFDDGENPSRKINIDSPPFIIKREKVGTCYIETPTERLDCEKLRVAQLLDIPCAVLSKGKGSGTLPNGSYQAVIAYATNEVRVTDYLILSNTQSLFDHNNLSGSLELNLTNLDQDYDEYELAIISNINQQTVVKRLGIYSTGQSTVYIDTIDPTLVTIPLNLIPLRTPAIEKSDAMFSVNNYLLRKGVYTKPEINYQLQANKIVTKWVSVRYPADYYYKGGNKVSYMGDEQYTFFIRWISNTGDRSASYLISGREPISSDLTIVSNTDAIETALTPKWKAYNTATVTSLNTSTLSDGGVVQAEGLTGYFESTEKYPDDKPEIWGDLCGKGIRLHKFPDATTAKESNHFNPGGQTINIIGVKFENITPPLDINGNVIQSIVGYEILRGSREGHRSIIAKGMINNLREYDVPGNTALKGLYQNYPYNDLRPDNFLTSDKNLIRRGGVGSGGSPLVNVKRDVFSFHSPETTFSKPFLSADEVKVYEEISGSSEGSFEIPYKHPKVKALTNFTSILSTIVGLLSALNAATTGVEIAATKDVPIVTRIGPVPPAPALPPIAGGIGGIFATVASIIKYGIEVIKYAATIVQVIAMTKILADATKEQILNLFYSLAPTVQFALQYNSHGFYNNFTAVNQGNIRRGLKNANYISNSLQSFSNTYRINNLNRNKFVALELTGPFADPSVKDDSRRLISEVPNTAPTDHFNTTISSYYAALKVNLGAQYGQVDSIKQVPISNCVQPIILVKGQKQKSDILFGGDTYINRFTEKTSMFFFNDWLYDQPDEYEYDYRQYMNVAYPRFWMDSTRIKNTLLSVASDFRRLDKQDNDNSGWKNPFFVKGGHFYLFNSGVKDFFVESEVNLAFRDWEDQDSKRHYDPYGYTDTQTMFRSDIIKSDNFYKYDYSLSNSRLFNSYITWGNVLPRDYSPLIAEKCYTYYPKRIIYSLPQNLEQKKDNWSSFLVNNYKDMPGFVTSIKPIGTSGALIMMEDQSPVQFTGVDQLQTTAGTKITIGDGGLFSQPLQNLVNADESYEYGSSQSRYGTIGTPYGVFWVSQEQGKIFKYSGSIQDITKSNNKWWFSQYLPSQLLKDFPDFSLKDNPIIGVGCQAIYDNTNEVIYFTKKDFKLRKEFKGKVTYTKDNLFLINGNQVILGDNVYFQDASWTVSYDPKNEQWISYHDWHPTAVIPSKTHFFTILDKGIWKHNSVCNSYCNFYGVNYPFEVEYVSSTGQSVSTMRSIEYVIEAYKYNENCEDKFHLLDYNFDRAIIYNSEQISGILRLNLSPKENPTLALSYPIVNASNIDILYSKEENKYRINQFWDITKDRHEFPSNIGTVPMFNTEPNGYISSINGNYVNYNKSVLEHKKFRHMSQKVFLRKLVSGDIKILLKLSNNKNHQSPR